MLRSNTHRIYLVVAFITRKGVQHLVLARALLRRVVILAETITALLTVRVVALRVHHHRVPARTNHEASPFGPPAVPRFASSAGRLGICPQPVPLPVRPTLCSRSLPTAGSLPEVASSVIDGIIIPSPASSATESIGAHSAAIRVTTPGHAHAQLLRVATPLIHDNWFSALSDAHLLNDFLDVPIGIKHGFRTGISSAISSTFIPANHQSALNQPDTVSLHIAKELNLGRYSGPFSSSDLFLNIGHFRTAPLGVVPKPNSTSFRIIQDLSFPRNDPNILSVNSEINSSDFPCEWGTFAQCYFLVASAPPGTQVSVFDVDSAYRNIPIAPSEQTHFCVSWDNSIYVDHCVAFGSASSAGLFGRVADAFVAIIKARGAQDILKWVDDIIFFRYPSNSQQPYSYSFDSTLVFDTAAFLGLPWSLPKFSDFSTSFTYLGFLWNIPGRIVQIPPAKKVKFANRCRPWLDDKKRTLKEAQQLLGSLNHCCLVLRSARTKLHSLRSFACRFPPSSSPFLSLTVPSNLRSDIEWWITCFSTSFLGSRIAVPPPALPLPIFVDASTAWGIGVLINGKWAAWRILPGTLQDGRAIGWAEMVAVELAVSLLCSVHPRNSHFLLHSDNQGVIGAITSCFSRGASQNSSLARLSSTLLNHDSFLSTKYIASAHNPADSISRGILPSNHSRLRTRLSLPQELLPYLERC